MKKFLIHLLFALPFAVFAQQTDLEKAGLRGRVLEVRLITEETDRRGFTFRRNPEITKYDSAGNICSLIILADDSIHTVQEVHYEYKGGLLVKKTDEMKVSILSGMTEERYNWNDHGLLTEKRTWEGEAGRPAEKLTQKETYRYDARGNCIEDRLEIFFPSARETTTRTVYNDSGRKLRIENLQGGIRQGYTAYTYNGENRVKTETERDDSGRAMMTYIYNYDQDGNTTMVQGIQYNYPSATIIRQTLTINTYRNGLLVESTSENNSQNDIKTEYRYSDPDSHGNWTKKETIRNEKLSLMERRRIWYY